MHADEMKEQSCLAPFHANSQFKHKPMVQPLNYANLAQGNADRYGPIKLQLCFYDKKPLTAIISAIDMRYHNDVVVDRHWTANTSEPKWEMNTHSGPILGGCCGALTGTMKDGIFYGSFENSQERFDIRAARSAFTDQEIQSLGNFHTFIVPTLSVMEPKRVKRLRFENLMKKGLFKPRFRPINS
ncbi:hypothetical protein niasHS_016580 [Heterodera schachtii]|uniref:Uncharacterized protein n=1 Tax=Heterodera schachtii TaxID=97005 RepID=A0ABD2HQL2_HETSC